MSEVCAAFGTTPVPGGALAQPWLLIQAIMDYRLATAAVAISQGDAKAQFAALQQNPALADVLVLMARAQLPDVRDIDRPPSQYAAIDAGQVLAAHFPAATPEEAAPSPF